MSTKNKKDIKKCLDDLQVVRFVLQKCSDSEHQEIETHISRCEKCFNEVVALIKAQPVIMDETNWGISPDLTEEKEKAVQIYKGILGNNVLRIVVQFVHRHVSELANQAVPLYQLKLMGHTGILYQTARLLGTEKSSSSTLTPRSNTLPTLFKIFRDYRVEVTIGGNDEEEANLNIEVKKVKEGILIPGVSFTLIDEKESKVLKELTTDGSVIFNNLRPSRYAIKIAKEKIVIGIITIDLIES